MLRTSCNPNSSLEDQEISKWTRILTFSLLTLITTNAAHAGVFNLYHYVEPEKYAVGFEPELQLTHGAGLGANGKFTVGLNDFLNAGGAVGTGGGGRKFRIGGYAVFDLFPDIEGQPGIGVAP